MDAREQGRVGFGGRYGGPGKYVQRAARSSAYLIM